MVIDSKALLNLAQKLSKDGMTEFLKNGKEAVSLSLMLPGKLTEKSRQLRKEMLKKEFTEKLHELKANHNVEIDFNSISPSAQTIQVKLGIDDIQAFCNKLEHKKLEVYPNTKNDLTL